MGFMDSYSQKMFRKVADSIGYETDAEPGNEAYYTVENRRVKCSMCGGYLFEPIELPFPVREPAAQREGSPASGEPAEKNSDERAARSSAAAPSARQAPAPVALECAYCGHIELFSGRRPVEVEH